MKATVKDYLKFIIGWGGLAIVLVLGALGCRHLRVKVERSSYSIISQATGERTQKLEAEFEHEKSFLKLMYDGCSSTEVAKGKALTKEQNDRIELVTQEMDALAVAICTNNGKMVAHDSTGAIDLEKVYKNVMSDPMRERSLEQGDVSIVRETLMDGVDGLIVIVPWVENDKIVGSAFACFNLNKYINVFSKAIYNNAGYSILCDSDLNVIIPYGENENREICEAIKNKAEKDGKTHDISSLFDNNTGFFKVKHDKDYRYIYMDRFSRDSRYIVVTVIDGEVIFETISPVTRLIVSLGLILIFLVVVYSIAMVVNSKRKRRIYADVLNYDELTGLPTKLYHKVLVEEMLKKGKGNFAYATCDVSEFKYFNSTFGYEYGNEALKHIANVLSDAILKDETVSRTSGDHFSLLLHYRDSNELTKRLNEILDMASNLPAPDDNHSPKAIFSCGVYLITNEKDVNRIRARANVARKGLKKSVSNQIAFYNEEDFNKDIETHALQDDLRSAVENNELVVFLQPKYGISNEEVIGAEALVRWNHKTRGLLAPNAFIPLAEKVGLIKEIDFYVFDKVCKKLSEWKKQGKNLITISVNFSREHLGDDDFVATLIKITKENDIEPKYLEVELTESAVYDEMGRLLDVMYLIKEAGFGLSMDDFGSGYSSLHLLREMPVDVLKLDKGFLDNCNEENAREKKVISHVISLAKDLQISVLAEGVETESQKSFLKEANCDMIQGYYYARPMPMEDFDKYVT